MMVFTLLALLQSNGTLAPGDGGPPLSIASQQVDVRIANGIAVTTITQVFHNASDRQLEAVYSFPVPADASLSSFSMWIDGKEIVGEVLESKRAREIYESITRTRKDPGLLEQTSHKLFQASVFPVNPRSDQRIQIAYYQPVVYDSGFCTYTYPLRTRTKEFSSVTGTMSIDVYVASDTPIVAARSPSHGDLVVTQQTEPRLLRASYELPRASLNEDFVLLYKLERERAGIHVTPFRDAGEDGYFMLTVTPGDALDRLDTPSHHLIVLDISGSMGGPKLDAARRAVEAVVAELGDGDTFQIVAFNVGAEVWPAEPSAERDVSAHLATLRAAGGTDIRAALQAAADRMVEDRPNVVVLMSDGLSDTADAALRDARSLFPASRARVFGLGVGNEINRALLSQLARDTGGWTDFVSTDGDVAHHAKLMARKIVHQSISDVEIRVDGVETYELHPRTLPHLFSGGQITVFGRYRGKGTATVTLHGKLRGEAVDLPLAVAMPERAPDFPEIRRSWALKAVEDAIEDDDAARVTALGVEHQIVTPYTSMLVLESEAQYGQFGIERRNAPRVQQERAAQEKRNENPKPSSGSGGSGGHGGAVEWVLLALTAGAAALSARRRRTA